MIDLTLRDIMNLDEPFGGKYVILGGDFRKTLPIVKSGSKQQILKSTLISSSLWHLLKRYKLTKNMRTGNSNFSRWLLRIGDCELENVEIPNYMMCDDIALIQYITMSFLRKI